MHDYPDVIQPATSQTDNFQFSNATSILTIYLVGEIGENSYKTVSAQAPGLN